MSGPGLGFGVILLLPILIFFTLAILSIIISLVLNAKNKFKLSKIFKMIGFISFIPVLLGITFIFMELKTPTNCIEDEMWRFDHLLNKPIETDKEAFAYLNSLKLPDNKFYDYYKNFPLTTSDLRYRHIKTKDKDIEAWTLVIWAITKNGEIYKKLSCNCTGRIYPWRKCYYTEN